MLVVGNLVAFVVAVLAIRSFIGYLTKHGFRVFGYYRILVGLAILVLHFWASTCKCSDRADMYSPETDLLTGRVLLIDKPEGWTSFDAVNKVKRALLHAALQGVEQAEERKRIKEKLKIGHAGTLDPLATGLLVVCTGPKTKTISENSGCGKRIHRNHFGRCDDTFV